MSTEAFIWRFAPRRTAPELLEAIFVQREPLLQDLLERVTESVCTGSKHHVLLIGPDGYGKTHLIALVNHRLSQDSALTERLRIAWLPEDETVTSFVLLLKRIYELLAQRYPTEFPLVWLTELLDESPKRIQDQLQQQLIQAFSRKTLLLCLENLDALFSGLGPEGQHEWRAFLQEHPFTTIIASTPRLFADVKSREKPFFGFFNPVPLEPLSVEDAAALLRRVAEHRSAHDLVTFLDSPDGRSRVRAMHHLTGGNHRIFLALASVATRESLHDLVRPFQQIADDLTPYYLERLRVLSPQQRQIVEYLSAQVRPCMPKQIARQLLATESSVSSQLKKLLEVGCLLRNERGRESVYELSEPLLRIAREVHEQRHSPLEMLVGFLRTWYLPDGWSPLRPAFERFGGKQATDAETVLERLRHEFAAGNRSAVADVIRSCAEVGALLPLGCSLIRSVAQIQAVMSAPAALLQWRDGWAESGLLFPELRIPLRIFSVGMEYCAKQDRRVLLDLAMPERKILEQTIFPGE